MRRKLPSLTLCLMFVFGMFSAMDLSYQNIGYTNARSPPVADAGPDQIVYIGSVVQFDGNGSYDPDTGWDIEVVDSYEQVGWNPSIAIDNNNNPHISYADSTHYDGKYAKKDGTRWHTEIVDTKGYFGYHNAMALDGDNNPHIVYPDGNNLRYARWTGFNWSIETVEYYPGTAQHVSIAIDSKGDPHITYCDFEYNPGITKSIIKYAKHGTGGWHIEVVDYGRYSSIVLDSNDNPHITYICQNLKYARYNGSKWNIEIVDNQAICDYGTSIALDNAEYPHISYHERYPISDLKYAKWNGKKWNIKTLDSENNVGAHSSLAIDMHNNSHVSYIDFTNDHIKYAKSSGNTWNIEIVEFVDYWGGGNSLDIDCEDNPHISYIDGKSCDLKYAKKRNFITSYDWDFGDGSPHGCGVNPTHIYYNSGKYEVTLTVEDAEGNQDIDTCIITVLGYENSPPIADAGFNQTTNEGEVVQFDGSNSSDPNGNIEIYEWDFGDGSNHVLGVKSTHIYNDPGVYQVTLKVEDELGIKDNDTCVITVIPNVYLKEGWNLISLQSLQTDTDLKTVMRSIEGNYDSILSYKASDGNNPWRLYHTSKPSDMNGLNVLNHTMAFWINITQPGGAILILDGAGPSNTSFVDLHPGWNMVGYPSLGNKKRTAALNNLVFGSDVDSVWTFDAATHSWGEIMENDYFEVGRGYWVHAKKKCVWEVPL